MGGVDIGASLLHMENRGSEDGSNVGVGVKANWCDPTAVWRFPSGCSHNDVLLIS